VFERFLAYAGRTAARRSLPRSPRINRDYLAFIAGQDHAAHRRLARGLAGIEEAPVLRHEPQQGQAALRGPSRWSFARNARLTMPRRLGRERRYVNPILQNRVWAFARAGLMAATGRVFA